VNRTLRTRLAVAAVSAPLALALVACGSDDDSDDGTGVSAPASTAAPTDTSTDAPATDDGTSTDSSPSASTGGDATSAGTALVAAATAQGAVDGSTVFAVDREDAGGWEVSVVDADGTEYDVRVSADGNSVEGQPVEDTDDGDDASRDLEERQRLLEVPVDYEAAADAASGSGSGEITGLELDEDNGTATWEVQYGEDTPDEVTVRVDAQSGEVTGTENDD
jgi:uncharacterized membrane protein YkoI